MRRSSSIFNFSGVIATFALALALVWAIGWGLRESLGVAPDTRLDQYYESEEALEAISLGNSHSLAFHFPSLDLKGHSFYGGGMDIATSALKLDAILDRTPNLDYVFLPVGPHLLTYDWHGRRQAQELQRKWLAYTPMPSLCAPVGLRQRLEILAAKIEVLSDRLIDLNTAFRNRLLGMLVDRRSAREACQERPNAASRADEFGIRHGYRRHAAETACLPALAQKTLEAHRACCLPSDPAERAQNRATNLETLQRMARQASARDVRLVLVAAPLTPAYADDPQVAAAWARERQEFAALASAHENTVFVDAQGYFDEQAFAVPNRVFYDDHHLTLEGAKIFSNYLRAALKIGSAEGGTPPAVHHSRERKN